MKHWDTWQTYAMPTEEERWRCMVHAVWRRGSVNGIDSISFLFLVANVLKPPFSAGRRNVIVCFEISLTQ